MRCPRCEHILWNHPAPIDGSPRACPECGRPYAIAEFEFARGKVEFQCPTCAQAYFGDSPAGRLSPSEFSCVRCGERVDEERCTLRPHGGDGTDAAHAMLREPLPWLLAGPLPERWWRTTRLAISAGPRLAAMLRPEPALKEALAYLAVSAWIGSVVPLLFSLAVAALDAAATGTAIGGVLGRSGGTGLALQGFFFLIAPGYAIVVAGIAAALSAIPGGRSDRSRFRRHLEILAYAGGSLAFGLIPFCGGVVSYVLWIVQGAQGVAAYAPRGQAVGPAILTAVGFLIAISIVGFVQLAAWFLLALV